MKFNMRGQPAEAIRQSCEERDVNKMSLFLSNAKSGEEERANLLAANTNGTVA